MTDEDYADFERAYKRAAGAYQMRWKTGDEDVARTYFKLLKGWSLDAVLDVMRFACQTITHFPKAAELVALLDRARPRDAGSPARHMSVTEVEVHARAAALGYRDAPCNCWECVEAGVADQELRFVPEDDPNPDPDNREGLQRAFNPRRGQIEPVGHWAHGHELARWYTARAAFLAGAPKRVRRSLHLVAVGRDPGQEG